MGQALLQQVKDVFAPFPPEKLGLAVSGGSDSVAMLHLVHKLSQTSKTSLHVVTVDHGLRVDAAEEAARVAAMSEQLGLPHARLKWEGWDHKGNMQHAARNARYKLMADWAVANDIGTIALGHTADDQAETVLMQLARRAGVDGLAAMPVRRLREGITWVRPLLGTRRAALREYLAGLGIEWTDDPSNEDIAFDRIKARKALATLAELGIDVDSLSAVATNMGRASRALDFQTFQVMREIGHISGGAVVFCARRWRAQTTEIQRRLLLRAIKWIVGGEYGARHAAIANAMQAISSGTGATVDGCQIMLFGGRIWIFREFQAVKYSVSDPGQLWDGRWRVVTTGPTPVPDGGLEVRALGPDGLLQCPDWRDKGRPHASLLSSPAVFSGDQLVAAPVAGYGQNWYAEIDGGEESFFAALLTH